MASIGFQRIFLLRLYRFSRSEIFLYFLILHYLILSCLMVVWYGMVWYGMLCYVILCYFMLCYVMLCYVLWNPKEEGTLEDPGRYYRKDGVGWLGRVRYWFIITSTDLQRSGKNDTGICFKGPRQGGFQKCLCCCGSFGPLSGLERTPESWNVDVGCIVLFVVFFGLGFRDGLVPTFWLLLICSPTTIRVSNFFRRTKYGSQKDSSSAIGLYRL